MLYSTIIVKLKVTDMSDKFTTHNSITVQDTMYVLSQTHTT